MLMLIWRVAQKSFCYRIFLVPSYNGIWAHPLGQDHIPFFSSRDCCVWKPQSAYPEHRLQVSRVCVDQWLHFASVKWPMYHQWWSFVLKTKGFLQLKHIPTMGRTSLQRALPWQWCAVSWATRVSLWEDGKEPSWLCSTFQWRRWARGFFNCRWTDDLQLTLLD